MQGMGRIWTNVLKSEMKLMQKNKNHIMWLCKHKTGATFNTLRSPAVKSTFCSQAHAKKAVCCPQGSCKDSIRGQKFSITLHSLKASVIPTPSRQLNERRDELVMWKVKSCVIFGNVSRQTFAFPWVLQFSPPTPDKTNETTEKDQSGVVL